MSKIKIYNGVTINMSTSDVIETGKIEYVESSKVSYCGGGGDDPHPLAPPATHCGAGGGGGGQV